MVLCAPVHDAPDTKPAPTVSEAGQLGLCLSGGGYRAMLFHMGTLWRLNELGQLFECDHISSVSGGSITAAVLGMQWRKLQFVDGVAKNFLDEVVAPIREMARVRVDIPSIGSGLLLPGSISSKVTKAYASHLFGDATLQDLPNEEEGLPRFTINATCVRSGVLWRFSRAYAANYRIGKVADPEFTLAECVAASSAFPPFLSPATIELPRDKIQRWSNLDGAYTEDLHYGDYLERAHMTDGGVYDNLGLEVIWRKCQHLLVSDAGGKLKDITGAKRLWPFHLLRVMRLIDNQVRNLRKRQLIDAFIEAENLRNPVGKRGAFWSIRSNMADYPIGDQYGYPHEQTRKLAQVKTRLTPIGPKLQEQLINWGYVACDTGLRSHWNQGEWEKSDRLPYPDTRLG